MNEAKPLENEDVVDVIRQIIGTEIRGKEERADFMNRQVEIILSDGYNLPKYRTVLFCVKGSPNAMVGYMKRQNHVWAITSDWGKFYLYKGNVTKRCPRYKG